MKDRKPIAGTDAIIATEGFIADVQFRIQVLLDDKGLARVDLARLMNVSEARVSQMFAPSSSNLTLRSVAKIFWAMDEECYVTSPRLERLLGPPDLESEMADDGGKSESVAEDQAWGGAWVSASRGRHAGLATHVSIEDMGTVRDKREVNDLLDQAA